MSTANASPSPASSNQAPASSAAQQPMVIAPRTCVSEIDTAIAHVRSGAPHAAVHVVLVVANRHDAADPSADLACGIAVLAPAYGGRSVWIQKDRLVNTGGARGELVSQIGRARALGAQIDVQVVDPGVIRRCAAGAPYNSWVSVPLHSPHVRASIGDGTVDDIRRAVRGIC